MNNGSDSDRDAPPEMTSAQLLAIADWLDTYDGLAASYFDTLEALGRATTEELVSVRRAAAGKEIQSDLRRWAAEMDRGEWLHVGKGEDAAPFEIDWSEADEEPEVIEPLRRAAERRRAHNGESRA